MLHMIFGGAGTGKTTRIMQILKQSLTNGATIRTLVPEQFAYTYDTMLYDALGAMGFNQLKTGSFRSLTQELLEYVASEPRDAADDAAKTVVLYRILQQHAKNRSLLFYGRQAEKIAFHLELQNQLNELMQSNCKPETLLKTAAALTETNGVLSEKLHDMARLYADYLNELEIRGLRDVLCDPMTATAAADGSGYLRDGIVFLDEFESFTGDQYAMLEVLLRDSREVYIALRTDDPDAPDFTRFDAVNQTVRRLRAIAKAQGVDIETETLQTQYRFKDASLQYLSQNLFTPQKESYTGEAAVTICEARDTTLEVEYTAAQIRHLLQSGQYRAGDIVVVMHDLAEYGFQLEAAFKRYEIPFFMDLRRSVLYTAIMKLPLCLLALAEHSSTEQILMLLKTQLSPLHPAEAAMLENYAYTWDIEGSSWDKAFVAETDPSGRMEHIRQKVIPPILRMRSAYYAQKQAGMTGAALCDLLYRCMDDLGIPKRVGGLASHMYDMNDVQGGRALRRLWNRFTELLDALHAAMTHTIVTPAQFAELMTVMLRSNHIPVPPQTLDAVTVQSAAAARYDAPKVVFVLGVNEGLFPADIQSGGFFTERERQQLAEQNIMLSRSVRELCADERLIVYKTLSAPSERLWLSYPLAGESGEHRQASALLKDVTLLLPKRTLDYADKMGAAFYVSTKAAAYYSYVQDYAITPKERASIRQMLDELPEEAERLLRLQTLCTPERLQVSEQERMRRLTGERLNLSATRIEQTMECPFMGFCAGGLQLKEREKKKLGALSVGNLVHYCMEQLFLTYPTRDSFLALSETELYAHAKGCAEDFLRNELGGRDGRPNRFLQQYERLTSRMMLLLRHTQAEMRQSAFAPDATEMVIGKLHDAEGTAPYCLSLSDGLTLCLNGKIDRVDVTEQDGVTYLRIVDYKTGAKQFKLADIYYGLNLQMLLYLFALLDDPNAYPDAKPAGVLYMPSGTPELQNRDEMIPVEELLSNHFKMSGTVLLDRGILTKMEREVAGVYIPAALAANDIGIGEPKVTKDSQVFTAEQLGRLRDYVEDMLRTKADAYAMGNVAPSPMTKKDSVKYYARPCRYCPYASLCGVTEESHAHLMREPEPEKQIEAQMLAIMNGQQPVEEV